jgi:ribonucleoside-diphosphate reductase alpha chain
MVMAEGSVSAAGVDGLHTGVIAGQVGSGSETTASEVEVRDVSLRDVTVVKRNGMMVPFRPDRIQSAVESAFRATHNIPVTEPLSPEHYSSVREVAGAVCATVLEHARLGECPTVEGIQDSVERHLMESGNYEVARRYMIYRNERKVLREDSPRNLKLFRRDGKSLVRFNPMKIASAIEKAFRSSRQIVDRTPRDVVDSVNVLTNKVVARAVQLVREGTSLHVELIQDEIERQMMAEGYYQVAKDFIIYRATRSIARAKETPAPIVPEPAIERQTVEIETEEPGRQFSAVARDGSTFTITERDLRARVRHACRGYEEIVSVDEILESSICNFYEGIREDEIETSSVMAAKAKIEVEPEYTYVAGRLMLDVIYRETLGIDAHHPNLEQKHAEHFKWYIKEHSTEIGRLDPRLNEFDLDKLASALKIERDLQFTYLGVQTLYDRYLIHKDDVRVETPQVFLMRVSMGLAINEGERKDERAIEFYDVLSKTLFMSSTPTLFNAGTVHSQLSSCYLSTVMDDLSHIFKVVSDDAQLSKWAGGLGNDWTNVRATGSWIKGTNGRSQGVIPFLKVANDTAVAVNQGGKRKGAMCAYLETWHLDIMDFMELRKNTGDERRRTHDMNTANWIPDLFMKRVSENKTWTLFSPCDVPDLHDLYGKAFEERYEEYERMVEDGELKLFKKVEAVTLWRKMLSMLYETGHPWMTFKDPSNIRSPQDHMGVVHSSNLCTEILLNTSKEETAVCNLGSVNLAAHIAEDGSLNEELLKSTVRTAIRMLDNVIDINFYPTPEARTANLRHRPVGLGLMGFQDALYKKGVSYASPEAVEFADESMEMISYYAILASSEVASEKGAYETYQGSKWDRGLLPIDTLELLAQERGAEWVNIDRTARMDWEVVRESIKAHGMRNSNTMAIAPTATISNITGVIQSIEPSYKHLYAKSNLSGEFTIVNTFLVDELKKRGLWDQEMLDDLKYFDGSIVEIERIPEDVKMVYLTAFEIEPEWLIECASRRQKWIDMGQSLNLYMAETSGKKLHDMYMYAWREGLKTTYYLRALGATQIEKSTVDINKRGLQPRWMKSKSASADIAVQRDGASSEKKLEVPKAVCNLDGDCESCQ